MASKVFFFLLLSCLVSFAQQKDSLIERKVIQTLNPLAELRDQLDDYFNEQNFNNAFWGVIVKSLKTGEVLYRRNADKLFIPASGMKLFTSAAALLLLGPQFVYETNLYANGVKLKGTLKGDLIIQGAGDPTISNRFYKGEPTKLFEDWADTLKSKGIYEITGNILGDDSCFDNIGLGKGWSLDLESNWYAAPSGGLSFNDNSIEIRIEPTNVNYPAKVSLIPPTKFVTLLPKVITVDENSEAFILVKRLRGTNLINVSGSIKKDSKPIIEHVSISDPITFFLTVLKEVFEKKGIIVRGRIGTIDSSDKIIISENLMPIYLHKSVPLKLIFKEMNKSSNNFYAEQILKTIGLEIYNYGTVDYGVKAAKELFNTMGINPDFMVMADGSGLSRLNLVTPRQIVNLLSFMYKNEMFSEYYESLPIAGVDGTLFDRMKRTSAENNVRAKPGYNENVSSLSGYLKTVTGEPIVFSIMVNNFLAPPGLANYIQDSVCHRIVNFNRN